MKKILIFITILIVLLFSYSQYKDYQRFTPLNADIKPDNTIDINYHNPAVLYNYYDALEKANSYMHLQWSANNIDVRNPENEDRETVLAVNNYAEKLAKVNYFEAILKQSKKLKNEGLTNKAIKDLENKGISIKEHNKREKTEKHKQLLVSMLPQKALYFGEKSAFIFEMQKLLLAKGYNIPVDGVYKKKTSNALQAFETKNNLYPDGKIDKMSLNLLLQ